ncbi:Hsp70 family protein [Streptomyces rishiriensis]|uniref:Molecular chaperone DnaK (HSP70) n=1 Tax=Streptomyces rishiriensis TaxID=68264 RepID=A0ABU0NGU8_STRRH|nr:Hsp70 family protein [Streptomyces rishiriensis]MDQ0578331.1 molecular chaperone DnaK (HSP70) [Streptomyces rishiriensis]
MTTRIGIDFGTANTVVAGWDHEAGRGVPIPLPGIDVLREAGPGPTQRVVPSLIAYAQDGTTRRLGAQVTPETDEDPAFTVFASTKSNVSGRAYDAGRPVGDGKVTGREAATRFLSDVMALAVLAVEDDDLEIVATAPVESFDGYRDWLVREVRDGLPTARLRVVDEATAAAVGYSARLNPGDVFTVIDFGAGTLDVSVVRVQEPDAAGSGAGVRSIAKRGLDLGGNTIDALLAEHAVGRLSLPLGDQIARNQVFRRLLASAEQAKRELAGAERAVISARDARTDCVHQVTVTRAEFDALLREKGVLRRVNQALRACLDDAASRGFTADDIRNVFLVGGSCLIPAVQDLVHLHFDPDVVRMDRPLEAVASGAAGIAGGRELFDHIQHDYAIRHLDRDTGAYEFETLVEAGTAYPTEEPVKTLTIRAVHERQWRLGLAIYELAHATYRDASAELEIAYDTAGGARAVAVTAQERQQRAMLWLNEDSPTFLEADPPATGGEDRFRLEFRIDGHKRLTVTAYDLHRQTLVLDRQPVVRLA